MTQWKKILLGIAIGFSTALASLALPQTMRSQGDVQGTNFGFPFWFVKQDLTTITRPLPAIVYISSPWENPTDFRLAGFFETWIFFALPGFILVQIISHSKK
ncbi:MAG: hypothetical protein WC787_01165 [Patescibacteria group bacterium]|jgi:hypothetical protein